MLYFLVVAKFFVIMLRVRTSNSALVVLVLTVKSCVAISLPVAVQCDL